MAVSPGGMSSSLENAASTTEEEERESPPTDAAGVVAGDGVCSPSSDPDEPGGVLQPLSGHTSCPGMYHSSGSEDSRTSDVVLFPAESSKIESTDSPSVESSTAGDNDRTTVDGLDSDHLSSAWWSCASGFRPVYDRGRGATVGVGTRLGTTELVVTYDEIEAVTVLATVVLAASLDTASVAKGTTASGLADDGAGG